MDDLAAAGGQEVDLVRGHLGHVHGDQVRPQQPQTFQATEGAHTVSALGLGDLVGGLVEMDVDRHPQILRQASDPGKGLIGDAVGGVRGEGGADQGMAPVAVM